MKRSAFPVSLTVASILAITSVEPSRATLSGESGVTGYSPGVSLQKQIQGRGESELVDFGNGRRLPVRDLRRLDAVSQKLRGAGRPLPSAPAVRPGSAVVTLRQRGDLLAALKRPDTEAVRLPSGRELTVGQLRFLAPVLEKRLGRPLESGPGRQVPSGPALKVSPATDRKSWKEILQQPDSTVLESPGGRKITVGELKQVLAPGSGSRHPASGTGRRP